ncbi:complement C1q tumor necrosis factor-related 6-like protein [Labeo rohita]|uniref:Complement C1q tumor necrosis factor-related 6-like protein n=1 Tax=Labeo rohita TaxID=84645 RepID=A0A498P195_LABRO|nr:complement C1q tumor necrosis factor-related 6-like protein [Labeo rohita]
MSFTLQSLKASMDQEQFRRKEEHNIAFSAALGNRGDFGPFNTNVRLVYEKVFLNAGSCYNSGTEERIALLASGQFQPQFLTGINSEVAELRSTVQQKEKEVQAKKTEHLTVEKSSALLASGDFQHIFTWIHLELVELRSTVCTLTNTLQVTEEKLEQLKGKEYKVAFAASLGPGGNVGPFTTDITLVYKEVFVNEGRAYSSATGIFTAPANGVYYFAFSGHNHSSKPMGLSLYKNGKLMITVYNHPQAARYETASNSISLILEKGDQVYMCLCACMPEVQKEEKEVQTDSTEHLNVEERGVVLASGAFLQTFLTSLQSELAELRSTVSSLKDRLKITEEQLEQLKRNEKYKVAFAATLGVPENTGPFNTDVTLVYKNVLVNTDKVYNPTTGV